MHPTEDPGDGRPECSTCGKYVWPCIHSCKGFPVTEAARDRMKEKHMGATIELLGAGEEFLTRGISTWAGIAPLRVWTVSEDGTPVEVTKENK